MIILTMHTVLILSLVMKFVDGIAKITETKIHKEMDERPNQSGRPFPKERHCLLTIVIKTK